MNYSHVPEKQNLTKTTLGQGYFERAKDFEFLEQFDCAIECYDKIIEIEPENFDALYKSSLFGQDGRI